LLPRVRIESIRTRFPVKQFAERAVTSIRDTLERLGPRYDEDSKRREDERHETDKTELTVIINRYRQLNTLMSPVPEPINFQTGRREKRGVITAIAIGIMAILARSAAAAHMASSSYGSYDKVELREMEDKVNVIKSATLNGLETIEQQFELTEKRHFTTLQALGTPQSTSINQTRRKVTLVLPLDKLSHQLSKKTRHEHGRHHQRGSKRKRTHSTTRQQEFDSSMGQHGQLCGDNGINTHDHPLY
jgi:hypothetical protein